MRRLDLVRCICVAGLESCSFQVPMAPVHMFAADATQPRTGGCTHMHHRVAHVGSAVNDPERGPVRRALDGKSVWGVSCWQP